MFDYNFYVYILSSVSGTLYVGMTNSLYRRLSEHKQNLIKSINPQWKDLSEEWV